ncbi:MAG: pyruvate kinase [Thermoplasmata archaeon]|nr:pyruvate kinase [Thermoplasmata archaeon]
MTRGLLCTLGPSSLNERVIAQLDEAGATLFRINMSHTDVGELERILRYIQKCTKVPISIDTEGARLRTGLMGDGVSVVEGGKVHLVPEAFWGDAFTIPITPGDAIGQLKPGARVSIDFDAVILRVDEVRDGSAVATILTGGQIGTRKAVTAFPSPALPTFSPKDLQATQIALKNGVREFSLSFCEHGDDVRHFREMVGRGSTIVAKIESREGVRNLEGILAATDRLLIDRGDLSREVRVEGIPLLQKAIIRMATARKIPVYVATNLLESMVTRRVPTRAEVNDVINTLMDGAAGLVLAAETAIGKHPIEAVRMMAALMREYERSLEGSQLEDLLGDHPLELFSKANPRPGPSGDGGI